MAPTHQVLIVAVALCVGCRSPIPDSGAADTGPLDADGDGYSQALGDCDDADATRNPGAPELCDGIDNDCDGATDEDDAQDASTWYADADADGYGDWASRAYACSQPDGFIQDSSDCDDGDAEVNPGATESCNGVDDDCDGTADEPDAVGATTWWRDEDDDGWGDSDHSRISCDQPNGYAGLEGDCDDDQAEINPGASDGEQDGVDQDCDGVDEPVDLRDVELVQLVVTELMLNPADELGASGQWVELTNAGAWDLDLSALEIQRGSRSFLEITEPSVLAAGSVLLVGHSVDPVENGGIGPDLASEELEFTLVADMVRLYAWGVVLDSVSWDLSWGATWRVGHSLALDEAESDPEDNDDADRWCLGLTPYGAGGAGSPGEANGVCPGSLDDADGDGFTSDLDGGDDCDDYDASFSPDAPEDCSDGLDQDCDGVFDCLDDDCWGSSECEDCSDGTDDDGDGLVDCEDGDCAGNPDCEELVCDDGLDSDNDGLVDCDDDDCWLADCHPGGVASRVHGGTMVQHARRWRSDRFSWRAAFTWSSTFFDYTHSAQVRSAWGTVQVLPSGVSSWDATTARSTCTWSVASADMAWVLHSYRGTRSETRPLVGRRGVTVAPGCRVAGSWFLPSEVQPVSGVGWADNSWSGSGWLGGAPWYQGSIITSSSWRSSSSGEGGSSHAGGRWTAFTESSGFEVQLSAPATAWRHSP